MPWSGDLVGSKVMGCDPRLLLRSRSKSGNGGSDSAEQPLGGYEGNGEGGALGGRLKLGSVKVL